MFRNIVLTLFLAAFTIAAPAQEPFKERIFALTSQEAYAPGSDLWFSLATLDADCRPLAMSRVAAVELLAPAADTVKEAVPVQRVRVALTDGRGRGFLRLPKTLSPGRYTLMAYTRNMQNEGEEFFFTKSLDIVSATTTSSQLLPPTSPLETESSSHDNDSLAFARFKAGARPIVHLEHKYRPEIDGEVILGRFVPDVGYNGEVRMPNLSILGNEIHYYPGNAIGNGLVEFVTPVLTGQTTLFTGCKRGGHVELLSPYRETESDVLSSPSSAQPSPSSLLGLHLYTPQRSYDLDQWRRFDTFKEMFLEFMPIVTTVNTDEGERIAVFDYANECFNDGHTLVLLDGVAVTVHDDLLRYDPHMVKYVDIYTSSPASAGQSGVGNFFFGHEHYSAIFSCTTHSGTLPRYELPDNTCMNHYEAVKE